MVFDKAAIEERQRRAAGAFGDDAPLVLVSAGEPIGKPGGLDQTYPFLVHPDYYWLTGSRRSGGILAFEPGKGWTHFVRKVDASERLWEGDVVAPQGEDLTSFAEWLEARRRRPLAALGSSGMLPLPADEALSERMRERLDGARRRKDAAEIALLRRAVAATAAGFAKAREVLRPGVSERQIQIELEAEMFRAGAHGVGFETIVGAGDHSAVLHFAPGERVVNPGDLVLIDAGGELEDYTADVTRTLPASERFTPEQQALYDLVLAAELAAIDKCRVGVEWHEVHRTAALVIAQGLKDLGVLVGDADGLADSGAVALFFPHGVGHMVGLRVRDVGGAAPGRPEGRMCCGARPRVDFPLEEGFLMTVEPGAYFIPAMLGDPERREKYKDVVRWDALEKWLPVGGVRIEDDVLVTASGPEVLTSAIPK